MQLRQKPPQSAFHGQEGLRGRSQVALQPHFHQLLCARLNELPCQQGCVDWRVPVCRFLLLQTDPRGFYFTPAKPSSDNLPTTLIMFYEIEHAAFDGEDTEPFDAASSSA